MRGGACVRQYAKRFAPRNARHPVAQQPAGERDAERQGGLVGGHADGCAQEGLRGCRSRHKREPCDRQRAREVAREGHRPVEGQLGGGHLVGQPGGEHVEDVAREQLAAREDDQRQRQRKAHRAVQQLAQPRVGQAHALRGWED